MRTLRTLSLVRRVQHVSVNYAPFYKMENSVTHACCVSSAKIYIMTDEKRYFCGFCYYNSGCITLAETPAIERNCFLCEEFESLCNTLVQVVPWAKEFLQGAFIEIHDNPYNSLVSELEHT